MKKLFHLLLFAIAQPFAQAQQPDTTWAFVVDSGSAISFNGFVFTDILTVQKDVILEKSIPGQGMMVLNGTKTQTLYVSNDIGISGLNIDNAAHVKFADREGGSLLVNHLLLLSKGRLELAKQHLILGSGVDLMGSGSATSFVSTMGTGQLIRRFNGPLNAPNALLYPIGTNTGFRPARLQAAGNQTIQGEAGIRVVAGTPANLPVRVGSHLAVSWPVSLTSNNLNAGLSLTATYLPADVQGTEADIHGYIFSQNKWTAALTGINRLTNEISGPVQNNDMVTGINRFVSVGARAYLAGPYEPAEGLMDDALRGSSAFLPNLIPLSDPYRSLQGFTHVANPVAETISTNRLATNLLSPGRNVVDWVFLQLRNPASAGNSNVIATRSALLLRNGSIVDVDGESPVTFNNVVAGNYGLTVRHRNHLGISMNPNLPTLFSEDREAALTTNIFDTRTAPNNKIWGGTSAFVTNTHPNLGQVKLMRAGNANGDNQVKYSGPDNDQAAILRALNGNPNSSLNGVYHQADLNMDRSVRVISANNDLDLLFRIVLRNNIFSIIQQQQPQ